MLIIDQQYIIDALPQRELNFPGRPLSHGIRGRGQALRSAADKDLLELADPPKGSVLSGTFKSGDEGAGFGGATSPGEPKLSD